MGDPFPFIALTSISTGGKYYWAKAFPSKLNSYFNGVQFSADGALLIVHSFSLNTYMLVFNVASGSILSARSYSTGGNQNYNYIARGLVVSSGTSPMAYALTNK